MEHVSRRAALRGMVALAGAAVAAPLRAQSAAPERFLSSDVGRLKRVLVHSLAESDINHDRLSDDLLPYAETDIEAAVRQHAALKNLLRAQGADVVELQDALAGAMEATRPSGVFDAWLRTAFPSLGPDSPSITPATILGRDPAVRFQLGSDGAWRHVADDTASTIFTRDSAVMTPRGLLLCRAASPRRRRENMLLRFVYRHSPLLRRYPVAFDAVEEGLIVEGGDVTVVDARTLLLGVGNRTDPRIAPVLARRLEMDVVTVQTMKSEFLATQGRMRSGKLAALRILLLHLDTYFTLVGLGHALAVPYLLEQGHAATNPLARFVRGARADTALAEDEASAALEMLKDFGRVRLFRQGTGREEDLGEVKLVDYLRGQRYRFTFVGGPRPPGDQAAFRHFMEVTYPEVRRQACNVVQAVPGRVIAYAGNPATRAALEADGIGVDTFEARELWAWSGGPHCLTQPLER